MERFTVINIVLVLTITFFSKAEPNAETPSDIHVSDDQTNSLIGTPSWKIKRPTKKAATTLQPLPDDSDSFCIIMEKNKVFVDKTFMMAQLLDAGTQLVLFTRPRRFGKTTFIGMLEEFFKGSKDLFKRTNMFSQGNTDDKNGTWKEYPVIRLDFGSINFANSEPSIEVFRKKLYELVQFVADWYGVGDCEGIGQCQDLTKLIHTLRLKFRMHVVILIDEYDRIFSDKKLSAGTESEPISPLVKLMTEELETFFGVIKSNINHIKLAFVTGVSRLAFASMSGSGGNNFVDISMRFPTMAGFSEDELKGKFWPHIKNVAKTKFMTAKNVMKKLHEMYDGYRFSLTDETRVFNPISMINCLRTCVFGRYWLATASLQLVVDRIIKSNLSLDEFRKVIIPIEDILRRYSALEVSMPVTVTLLVYGYLTIKEVDRDRGEVILDFPNDEVKEALNNAVLIAQHVKYPGEIFNISGEKLRLSLMNHNIKDFFVCMNNLGFRSYGGAYDSAIKDEFYPTRVIAAILTTRGFLTEVGKVFHHENGTRAGDLDLQVLCARNHYVFEFKYGHPNAVVGMVQLIEYIVEDESRFRKKLLEFRKDVLSQGQIKYDYNMILVSANMKGFVFQEFLSLPYRINKDGSGELGLEEVKTVSQFNQMNKLKGELTALARKYPTSNLLKNVNDTTCKLL